MRKVPHTAGEDLLETVMRRGERAATLLTPNRPVEDWGKLLGRTAPAAVLPDRLLHHAHVHHLRPAELAHPAPERSEYLVMAPPLEGDRRIRLRSHAGPPPIP